MLYGMAALVTSILVWLNVFFHSDVIRVGNRTELIRMFPLVLEAQGLTHSIDNRFRNDGIHRPTRLFRNHAQQSTFPRRLYILTLGLSRSYGLARVYRLQAEDVQLGRKDQSPVVAIAGYRRSSKDSGCCESRFEHDTMPY